MSTTSQSVGSMPYGSCGDNTDAKILGFLVRVGLSTVVENRKSLARVGGRNRRRFAKFHARFGVDTDVLWTSS